MYVRMSHWNCLREFWGEDQKLFTSRAVPIMQAHKGFEQASLLGEPGATARIAFTVWTSKADYQKFVESPDLPLITDLFQHMYVDGVLPAPTEYEIRAQGMGAAQ